jgi:hypothetical protein
MFIDKDMWQGNDMEVEMAVVINSGKSELTTF